MNARVENYCSKSQLKKGRMLKDLFLFATGLFVNVEKDRQTY